MVQVEDRILLILFLLEEISEKRNEGYYSLEDIASFLPTTYPQRNFHSAIFYRKKVKEIEKIRKGSEVLLRLTKKGKEKMKEIFPLFSFHKKPWDGRWRVLVYDIPDSKKSAREMLRRKIKQMGFGMLQGSIYISPFPIEKEMIAVLDEYGLSDRIVFMTADNIFSGGDKFLAESIWKISRINKHYSGILEALKEKNLAERDKKRLKAEFMGLICADPFLPEELLPNDWNREKLIEEIQRTA